MHILILPSWYFPPDSKEISGRMFHQLARGLREEGVDARVLHSAYSTRGPVFKKTTFALEDEVPTWRTFHFFLPKANTFLVKLWIDKYVKDILAYIQSQGRPDLIHAHSYLAASVCVALHKRLKIPFIYTERLSGFIVDKVPKHHAPYLPACFEKATTITCVSPGLMNHLQQYTQKEIIVMPNFYDEKIFYSDQHIKKDKTFTWVSIGEPAHVKGLDVLFHAFAALKKEIIDADMKLLIIDEIPEKEELIKLAQLLRIENKVFWKGLISQQEIADLLRNSHVLISASRVETFGKAILEAQACGLPVIATKTDGAQYILSTPEQGILTEIGSHESLVIAMEIVYKEYTSYQPEKIHNIVEKRFSKKIVIQQWINLYNTMLS